MEPAEHAAGAGNECHLSGEVIAPPESVDLLPASAGNSGSSMHAMGVGRVVPFVMIEVQGNFEGANYPEIGLTVGAVGVEQGSVPVKQNGAKASASAYGKQKCIREIRLETLANPKYMPSPAQEHYCEQDLFIPPITFKKTLHSMMGENLFRHLGQALLQGLVYNIYRPELSLVAGEESSERFGTRQGHFATQHLKPVWRR